MVNILPDSYKKKLRRAYVLRVLTVGVGMLVAVVLIAGILSFPHYIHFASALPQQSGPTGDSDTILSADEQNRLHKILASMEEGGESSTAAIASIRGSLSPMLELNTIMYEAGSWQVSAHAQTREAMLTFTERLEGLEWVDDVELPVEALAQPRDVTFTITITPRP